VDTCNSEEYAASIFRGPPLQPAYITSPHPWPFDFNPEDEGGMYCTKLCGVNEFYSLQTTINEHDDRWGMKNRQVSTQKLQVPQASASFAFIPPVLTCENYNESGNQLPYPEVAVTAVTVTLGRAIAQAVSR
jgi:hypothetical protein